jgi:acetamidase/formamidase
MITPHLDGGHEITEPVAVEGATIGDAIAVWVRQITVTSKASASGTGVPVDGTRATRGSRSVRVCPGCGETFPRTVLNGAGPEAIVCARCGTPAAPYRIASGYTVVLDQKRGVAMTVDGAAVGEIAEQAVEYAALPASSRQYSVLSLAPGDLPGGILTRMRPFIGNLGTTPAMDVSASANCGDFGQGLREGGLTEEDFTRLTDGHLDADSVREGAILICPVKVDGGGVYAGDVHAMQGDGEIAGHTTDVSARVVLQVEVIKGLDIEGPLLLPPSEDLPYLARPYDLREQAAGRKLAEMWDVTLEDAAPVQVVGSGPDLNAATERALKRTAALLRMSVDEVKNRVTISGSVEIGRAPGLVLVTLLAPMERLRTRGLAELVEKQYGLSNA